MSRAFVTQSISSTALCVVAALILTASLISSNRVANGAKQRFSSQQFNWGTQVLPDNPFYLILMANDRAGLWFAAKSRQPQLRLQFAEHRFQTARTLASQNKGDLAISTLSKSQIYVLDAARQFEANGMTVENRAELQAALDHSLYRMELFHEEYPELDTTMLRSLREETAQRLGKLQVSAK